MQLAIPGQLRAPGATASPLLRMTEGAEAAQGHVSHSEEARLWKSVYLMVKGRDGFLCTAHRGCIPCACEGVEPLKAFALWHTGVMHRLTLGDLELTVFSDGTYPLDGGAFFGVIPKVMWSRRVQPDEKNYVTAGLNSLLIRTGKLNVLVETGMGNKLSDRMIKFYGQPAKLLENLSEAGIAPEDIDVVINSHLHFDHCGWNTVRDRNGNIAPTFPKAKYYAPDGEWQYARKPSERDAISYIPENYDPLVASGQMTLLKGNEEIVPGISVKTFPGHTAHMLGIIVRGGQKPRRVLPKGDGHQSFDEVPTACYISDLIPTTAHIDITWGMGFDLYPLQTVESKKQYYAQSIPERWLTVFTHDPRMPWAFIEKDEAGKMVAREAAVSI